MTTDYIVTRTRAYEHRLGHTAKYSRLIGTHLLRLLISVVISIQAHLCRYLFDSCSDLLSIG
jgi:hypothetical protein